MIAVPKSAAPPIYLIPGMTAEYPVFSRLTPLLPNAMVVNFIEPRPSDSLIDYAQRMAEQFTPHGFIAGVSFGGIVALEISRIVRPKGCVLISSIREPHQFPPWMRVSRAIGGRNCSRVLRLIGDFTSLVPASVRSSATMRARKLSGVRGAWHRWATSAVLDWRPEPKPIGVPLLLIHGTADATFPIRYIEPHVVVPNGRHALPQSHPIETANAILAFTEANSD